MDPLRLTLLALVGALALACAPAVYGDGPVVRRTTLIVHDIERSIAFYRDVLGFELWMDAPGTVGPNSLPSHAPEGAPSRFVIMKGRHPWVGMVGLLQYGEAREPPGAPARLGPGDAVLMVEVPDVGAIHERMRAAGTSILRPPRTTEVTGADGASWTATFLFAFDPDGHLLELNQRHGADADAGAAGAAADEPVTVRRRYVDYRYGQLHLREARPARGAETAPPLLLFHQTPLSGALYDTILPLLATDRVVYAVDTPGYGESDPPPEPLSIEGYAGAIADFVTTLPGPVDVLGYHTGVLLAMELARALPGKVRRAVLVSVPMFSDEARAAYEPNREPVREDGSHLAEAWESSMRARAEGQSLERIAEIVAEKQRAGMRSWWAGPAIFAYDTRARLAEITQPVLVVQPGDSLADASAEASALLANGRLAPMLDVEYGLFDVAASRVAGAVRAFLDGPGGAGGEDAPAAGIGEAR